MAMKKDHVLSSCFALDQQMAPSGTDIFTCLYQGLCFGIVPN